MLLAASTRNEYATLLLSPLTVRCWTSPAAMVFVNQYRWYTRTMYLVIGEPSSAAAAHDTVAW